VGLENLANAIGEEADTIEDVLEPFLIQQGYLQRTPRGRIATLSAYRHFGLVEPSAARDLLSDRGAPASASRFASTTRTPTPAAWCSTRNTWRSWSARAPSSSTT
jgi:hypothetical protein